MKKTITELLSIMLIISMMLGIMSGCSPNENGGDTETNPETEQPAPDAVIKIGETYALYAGGYRLDINKQSNGYGISVISTAALPSYDAPASDASLMFINNAPAEVNTCSAKTTSGAYKQKYFKAPYDSVTAVDNGYVCTAEVKTDGGAVKFTDSYYITDELCFALDRKTEAIAQSEEEAGFQTVYSLCDPEGKKSSEDFDFFIPSILYKDSKDTVRTAIGANLNVDKMYVKETRTALPLAMLRRKDIGYSVAIAHLDPQIDVSGIRGGGSDGDVNDKLQYGSVGYKIKSGVSVDFCYPSYEGPVVYYSNAQRKSVYHPLSIGATQEYSVSIIPASENTYADAMTKTYQTAYQLEDPDVTDEIDIDSIYDDNIDLFTRTYRRFGTGSVIAAGVPWSIDLKRGTAVEYTFQMGFVGQQTSVGYNLLAEGYKSGDDEMMSQGNAIIDFWTSRSIMRSAVPIVWWDPRNSASAGQTRGYPSFLRCFVDGMEGVLDAYKIAYKNGDIHESWLAALIKVGDFLVENQNSDGSYYRAYNTNGTVCTDTSSSAYQGTSKLNTPIAIRFLAKMYELTGEEKYKTAAQNAAEFSYNELYIGLEKYVGGTPDNPNTVDKEAAIYAMYGFNAAYALTGDEKYLNAAQHAATSAMSWVYCYDFGCPASADNESINPFSNGRISGFSIIATGHSGADNYSASMYYEMFKLYIYTENEFYLNAARLLQNNTKLSTDYNGEMGWKYRALGPEATNVSDFDFGTVGVWLPWSGIVNIKPIGYMRDTFGNGDIDKLTLDMSTLREALETYGIGGSLK